MHFSLKYYRVLTKNKIKIVPNYPPVPNYPLQKVKKLSLILSVINLKITIFYKNVFKV